MFRYKTLHSLTRNFARRAEFDNEKQARQSPLSSLLVEVRIAIKT